MSDCGLKQSELADVLGARLDRVKSLTSGRVQKLSPDETRRLVQTLNLSAHWLATGEEPMFNPQGGEQLGELLTQVRLAALRVQAIGLSADEGAALISVVTGLQTGKAAIVRDGLASGGFAQLDDGERALLANYRVCGSAAQQTLVQTSKLLAAGLPAAPSDASHRAGGAHSQHNVGDNAIQIGSSRGKVKIKKGV